MRLSIVSVVCRTEAEKGIKKGAAPGHRLQKPKAKTFNPPKSGIRNIQFNGKPPKQKQNKTASEKITDTKGSEREMKEHILFNAPTSRYSWY